MNWRVYFVLLLVFHQSMTDASESILEIVRLVVKLLVWGMTRGGITLSTSLLPQQAFKGMFLWNWITHILGRTCGSLWSRGPFLLNDSIYSLEHIFPHTWQVICPYLVCFEPMIQKRSCVWKFLGLIISVNVVRVFLYFWPDDIGQFSILCFL